MRAVHLVEPARAGRAKNVGWRIDYMFGTEGIARDARSTFIYKDEKFSDHAPLVIDFEREI